MRNACRRNPSWSARGLVAGLALAVSAAGAAAQLREAAEPLGPVVLEAQTWAFSLTTSGQDVQWTSPTSVDPNAAVYAIEYQISSVLVDVEWSIFSLDDVDVTDQIPPELQVGSTTLVGPAPVSFENEPIAYPEPPAQPGLAALLTMGLDANGFGFLSATNIVLGDLVVDLPIFGTQTVTLTSISLSGQLTIHPAWFDLGSGLAGTLGAPTLTGDGALAGGDPVSVTLSGALPGSTATLVIGFTQLGAPFKGGTLVPDADLLILGLPTGPIGDLALAGTWPAGLPSGFSLYLQEWVVDPGGPAGFSATNGLRAVTP